MKTIPMKTILMTGAAGRIGTFMRAELAGKYKLRLSDIKPVKDLKPGETFMRADISNLKDALRLVLRASTCSFTKELLAAPVVRELVAAAGVRRVLELVAAAQHRAAAAAAEEGERRR